MNLYKKEKTWYLRFMVDGVRHNISCHTHERKQAEAFKAQIEAARRMSSFEEAVEVLRLFFKTPAAENLRIDLAWEKYMDLAKAIGRLAIQKKTLEDRRRIWDNFAAWAKVQGGGITAVAKISGSIAARYAEELALSGRKAKTRQNIIGHLSAIWTVLEKAEEGIKNPWIKLAPTDTDSQRLPAFTPAEEIAVLEAARRVGKDWWPICVIARHTGLRYGDIATLRWDQVCAKNDGDYEGGIIIVEPHKTKKFGIQTSFPIIKPIAEALASITKRGDYLFPLHAELYGRRGKNVQALLNFREVLNEAGILGTRHTFHSWRHTAATRLAEAGADIEVRKRILGHRTAENAERYDHAAHLEEVREAMEKGAREQGSRASTD